LDDLPFPGWGFSKRLLCLGDRVSERGRESEKEKIFDDGMYKAS
jgi:hypothetical protein